MAIKQIASVADVKNVSKTLLKSGIANPVAVCKELTSTKPTNSKLNVVLCIKKLYLN